MKKITLNLEKIWSVGELAGYFFARGNEARRSHEEDELFYSGILALLKSLERERPILLSKSKTEPWDIVILDEEEFLKQPDISRHKKLSDGLFVQQKKLFQYGWDRTQPMNFDSWLQLLQERISSVGQQYRSNEPSTGILYIPNLIPVILPSDIKNALQQIRFDGPFPFYQVILAYSEKSDIPLDDPLRLWQIYPSVEKAGTLTKTELPKLREIIAKSQWTKK